MKPASIGKRTGALIIDTICFCGLVWLFGHLMIALGAGDGDLTLILAVLALPAVAALCCWLVGNTPGKKALGLYIVDIQTGEDPTLAQYLRRVLLFPLLISLNIIFVIPVLVTKNNRAFHDMIAGTLVIEG